MACATHASKQGENDSVRNFTYAKHVAPCLGTRSRKDANVIDVDYCSNMIDSSAVHIFKRFAIVVNGENEIEEPRMTMTSGMFMSWILVNAQLIADIASTKY